jgi:hypothetical protein
MRAWLVRAEPGSGGSGGFGLAGGDQAGLVGQHDGLGAVTEVELGEKVRTWVLTVNVDRYRA